MPLSNTISGRSLLLQILVASLMLAAANVGVSIATRNSLPRQILRSIDTAQSVDGAAFGNSLIQEGFNAEEFDAVSRNGERAVHFLNAGLGFSSPVEHLLLFRRLLQKHPETGTIIYGFFDQQLTESPTDGWADLAGNRAMSYYVEPYFAAELYEPKSELNRALITSIGHVPMLVERLALWAKIEKFRRILGAIGLPRQDTNRFGRSADFSALEAASGGRFATTCKETVDERLPLTPAIDELLRESMSHSPPVRVVIVCMPMSPFHQKIFYQSSEWHGYLSYLQSLLQNRGCTVIDASDWIPDSNLYMDHLHLNDAGAKSFSDRLAQTLARTRSAP